MNTVPQTRPPPFFLADHLALDLLNSRLAPSGQPIEWLSNGADLVNWLTHAGAIGDSVASLFREDADATDALDDAAEQVRRLREWFRGFAARHAGRELTPAALAELKPLNRLLARDDSYRQIAAAPSEHRDVAKSALGWRLERRWTSPERLLQPIADAMGDLVCNADFRLVKTCEGPTCTVMFYDRTKAHGRRWCSMALCGNRAKAATHRAKRRHVTALQPEASGD